MKSNFALAAFILFATSCLGVAVAESPALKAFVANAWTCLDQDIPPDTKDLRLEQSRKDLQLTLERMGRFSQVLDVQVYVIEKTSDPNRRASVRQQAKEAIAMLEADAKKVVAFRNRGVPSLGSEMSQNLFQRVVEELESTRSRIAEKVSTELMYLIEFTQDLLIRLVGTGIFFRAVITEGEFYHDRLEHMDAFFGQALVDTYKAEKQLIGTGLFLDVDLRRFNQVFRSRPFSSSYDFVFLTHSCTGICPKREELIIPWDPIADAEFPLPGVVLESASLEYMIYPEIVHFQAVHKLMHEHPDPNVRAKHLATWSMYEREYPRLIGSLVRHGMDPKGVASLDWSAAKERFEEERA